jgi:hypothetical protein
MKRWMGNSNLKRSSPYQGAAHSSNLSGSTKKQPQGCFLVNDVEKVRALTRILRTVQTLSFQHDLCKYQLHLDSDSDEIYTTQ